MKFSPHMANMARHDEQQVASYQACEWTLLVFTAEVLRFLQTLHTSKLLQLLQSPGNSNPVGSQVTCRCPSLNRIPLYRITS